MLAIRASFAILASAAVLLSGCSSPAGPPVSARDSTVLPTASPTTTSPAAVQSAQPDPLINVTCADFAAVATMGTIAGVTERDPRAALNDSFDVVSVADIVRNAGGVACEFSDGGAWRDWRSSDLSLNESWRGAAIFVLPNFVNTTNGDVKSYNSCGDESTTSTVRSVCSMFFTSGSTLVNLVLSWNDRGATYLAVKPVIVDALARATITPGPVPRPTGTFHPPHDCASLIPDSPLTSIFGAPGAVGDVALEVEFSAQSTYSTENIGCEWYVDGVPLVVEVLVYPGGAWAAELTLPALGGKPVELSGAREGDTALSHCYSVAEWGFWLCTVEVIADGTWIHATGNAESEEAATAAAISAAEATLANRT